MASAFVRDQHLDKGLLTKVDDPWWHEVIRFHAATRGASAIVAACSDNVRLTPNALALAVDCVEQTRAVKPELQRRLGILLAAGTEDTDPEVRRVAAEALLRLRLRGMVPIAENTFSDPGYISHAEYQLFLDEKRASGEYRQPDHWRYSRFPAGKGSTPVVGIRSSDAVAFCAWLSDREAGLWRFRLPRAQELPCPEVEREGEAEGCWVSCKADFTFERAGLPDQELLGKQRGLITTSLTQALERDFDFDFDLDLDLDLASARTRARASDSDSALLSHLDIALARECTSDLSYHRAHSSDGLPSFLLLRRLLRTDTSGRASARDRVRNLALSSEPDEEPRGDTSPSAGGSFCNMALAISVTILELRIEGKLNAFEGLRIVREQVPEDWTELPSG